MFVLGSFLGFIVGNSVGVSSFHLLISAYLALALLLSEF
jgi:hypothetical protein